jgi:hypothetical protein
VAETGIVGDKLTDSKLAKSKVAIDETTGNSDSLEVIFLTKVKKITALLMVAKLTSANLTVANLNRQIIILFNKFFPKFS